MRRIELRALALAMLALFAVLMCSASGASASNGSYVAMGDSYTSGPGIPPAAEGAPADCGQSANNYPHIVARDLNLTLTDVSCGGAQTKNFEEAQHEDQPPQFNALSESTEVVTIGMGGNDGGLFGGVLQGCTETDAIKKEAGKAPCAAKYQEFVTTTFAADKGPQEAALKRVKELAPHAKVFVVGYPEITPQNNTCLAFPWYPADMKWFRDKVQKVGNKMIKEGAKANGAFFVDTFKASEGHNACEPVGTRWIEPLIEPLLGVPVHPNALGEENDAFDVMKVMLQHGVR